MTENPPPESPCVKNCCLDENDICLGCHRSLQEIIDWADASAEEKRKILQRAEKRKSVK